MTNSTKLSKPVVLIIDDNPSYIRTIKRVLKGNYKVIAATNRDAAISALESFPDVILLDLRLSEDEPVHFEGIDLLRYFRNEYPHIPIIILTAYDNADIVVQCMKEGAIDFVSKSHNPHEVRARVTRALAESKARRRMSSLEREFHLIEPREIIGKSPKIKVIRQFIQAIAQDGYATVLIRGETGTGKELVARAIHASGWRAQGPFVPVVVSTIPEQLIESELFGHEKGAFTGAEKRHIGFFERAHEGVLFLDEIGDAPLSIQIKLLRFLEERIFYRVGGGRPITVNVQIIAATNADLERLVQARRFRQDLLYRLKVHEIHLPPLRERREDIPLLVAFFLQQLRAQGRRIQKISPSALRILETYYWPGNVRQLKNVIDAAAFWATLKERNEIYPEDLPHEIRTFQKHQIAPKNDKCIEENVEEKDVDIVLARTELSMVERAISEYGSRRQVLCKRLGYSNRFTMYRRIRRWIERYPELAQEFPLVAAVFQPRMAEKRKQ